MYYRAGREIITICMFVFVGKATRVAFICKNNKCIWFYLFVG